MKSIINNTLQKALFFLAVATLFSGCVYCEISDIDPRQLPAAKNGSFYSLDLIAITNCRPTFEDYRIIRGDLPPGMVMDVFGRIQGVPSRSGRYLFTVDAEVCYSEDFYGYYNCTRFSKNYELAVLD